MKQTNPSYPLVERPAFGLPIVLVGATLFFYFGAPLWSIGSAYVVLVVLQACLGWSFEARVGRERAELVRVLRAGPIRRELVIGTAALAEAIEFEVSDRRGYGEITWSFGSGAAWLIRTYCCTDFSRAVSNGKALAKALKAARTENISYARPMLVETRSLLATVASAVISTLIFLLLTGCHRKWSGALAAIFASGILVNCIRLVSILRRRSY